MIPCITSASAHRMAGVALHVVLALSMLIPAIAAAQQFPPDEDLQVMLDYLVADGEAPGIVLGIVEADGSVRILTAGSGGPGTRPLGARSTFEIGSINKTFTGLLLAEMAARGEVALDDPISRYLPDGVRAPSRNGREITLVDLATHRSGLPRLPNNHRPADGADPYADYSLQTMYDFLSSHELRRDPGAEAEYSNLGFGLLGHLLARAAGQSYRSLLRERILEPLGMDMTGYTFEGELAEWHTKGHSDAGQVVPYWFGTEAIDGAGGLRSTMEDMLAYLRAHLGPADSQLQQAMRAAVEVRDAIGENASIGLGWQVRDHEGRSIIAHGGGTGGYSTLIAFDPELGVGFVRLANATGYGDDLGLDFLRRGLPLDIPEVAVAGEVLDRYVGAYEAGQGSAMAVRREADGTLTLQAPGNVRFRMYAESDTSFFLKRAPWRIAFAEDGTGGVSELTLTIDGAPRTARKIGDQPPPAGVAPAPTVLDLSVTDADIARYEGTYRLEAGGRPLELRVFGQDGHLMAQAAGQPVTRLRYQGDHVFVPDFDDAVRLVFTVQDARALRVTLHQGGGEVTGDRQP